MQKDQYSFSIKLISSGSRGSERAWFSGCLGKSSAKALKLDLKAMVRTLHFFRGFSSSQSEILREDPVVFLVFILNLGWGLQIQSFVGLGNLLFWVFWGVSSKKCLDSIIREMFLSGNLQSGSFLEWPVAVEEKQRSPVGQISLD
jgi:hypothetical protein